MWWSFKKKREPHAWYLVVVLGDALGTCANERTCTKCQRYEKRRRGKDMKFFTEEVVETGLPEKPCYERT